MHRFLSLFLLVALTLHALNNNDILKRADGFLKSSNKSDYFRAYNDYKNLYLRSMMSDDLNLKRKSLDGIVKSGGKLHIDVSDYAKELATLKPAQKTTKKKATKKEDKKKQSSKISSKKKKDSKIKITPMVKLERTSFKDGVLVLEFDKELSSDQVKHFTLKDKKKVNRYVFDVSPGMLFKSKIFHRKGIDRIKLAQFNPKTLRLVISDRDTLKIKHNISSNRLEIGINASAYSFKRHTSAHKKKAPSRLDRDKTIVIDAGHGGKDPGAIGYRKYREKIIVMGIAKRVSSILKSRGFRVHMTRDKDRFVKLSKRTKYANKKNADIFISIHANAVGKKTANKVHGIETYFLSKSRSSRAKRVAEKENSADLSDVSFYGRESFLNTLNTHNIVASNKLAIDLQRGMLGSLKKKYKNVNDGGVREGPFWVLVGAQMPSVLVEVGFITHPREARRLVSSSYQQQLAQGIANGVERYFANCAM